MFKPLLTEGLLNIAQKKKLVNIHLYDLRKWTTDKHKSVDDKPYGGGAGMIFKINPVYKAVASIKEKIKDKNARIIVMAPSGSSFTQKKAFRLSKFSNLIIICPRYEGIDNRVIEHIATDTVSIGKYVLSGGEIPAMVIVDSIARCIPGVLGNPRSIKDESFSGELKNVKEYPQYTRPKSYKGWKVPEVLTQGDHKKIENWKKQNIR